MNVYGLDFTSAPSLKKPITEAQCVFENGLLNVRRISSLIDFEQFETFLDSEGEWIAGIDFPFGQPQKLLIDLGWPNSWEGYVKNVSNMQKRDFGELLRIYRTGRAKGDKQHKRLTDDRAKSCSPMMWYGVPVGKMFFEGAPRLLRSKACVLPFHALKPGFGIIVEAYPKLVARVAIGDRSYKSDNKRRWTADREKARKEIVEDFGSRGIRESYGFQVCISKCLADELIADGSADRLDAVLCAIQAAWSYTRKGQNYGMVEPCATEGWIVDPALCRNRLDEGTAQPLISQRSERSPISCERHIV